MIGLYDAMDYIVNNTPSFSLNYLADTITDSHPNSSAAWNQKAYSLQKSGNYTEALNGANQATQIDQKNTLAWNTKASILIHLERYDEALAALNETIRLKAFDDYALKTKDYVLEKLGVSTEGSDSDLVAKASKLQRSKKMDEALTVINQAIQQDPSNTEAWNTKATILLKMGNRDGALKALNQTIQIKPDDIYAWQTKASTLILLDRYDDETLAALDQEFRLKSSSDILNNKACVLQKMGRYDEAPKVINQALQQDPKNWYAPKTKESILSNMAKK